MTNDLHFEFEVCNTTHFSLLLMAALVLELATTPHARRDAQTTQCRHGLLDTHRKHAALHLLAAATPNHLSLRAVLWGR